MIELAHITTRDGVRLDGSLQTPAARALAWPVDGVCLVHGTGGNFYASTLFDLLAERCLQQGCAVLRINTRGHDGISTAITLKGGRRLGAAYEVVDECRHDLSAWIEWLKTRAGPRVGLIGHSLGAVKGLYALAHEPGLEVAGMIGISPPRLSYSWFCSQRDGADFLASYQQADALVQAGQPGTLLEVRLPLPMVISAAGYVEKYGPSERYNYLRFVRGVRCPLLITFGALESAHNMAFQGAQEALLELRPPPQAMSTVMIAGADHFYTAARSELLSCIEKWWTK